MRRKSAPSFTLTGDVVALQRRRIALPAVVRSFRRTPKGLERVCGLRADAAHAPDEMSGPCRPEKRWTAQIGLMPVLRLPPQAARMLRRIPRLLDDDPVGSAVIRAASVSADKRSGAAATRRVSGGPRSKSRCRVA